MLIGAQWNDVERPDAQPTPFTPNEFVFGPSRADSLRVVFEHDKELDSQSDAGVTEWMAFEP